MSSTVAKPQPTTDVDGRNPWEDYEAAEEVEGEGGVVLSAVTSQVCIRSPGDAAGTLNKEAVLRQIRQRKRMNRVRGAVHGLFGRLSRSNSNKDKPNGKPRTDGKSVSVKWADDAFAGP
ncbi:unnamed protein product [Linum trigynum]|uniref:Uncharacterized protein n=1 Tax=Linum trigynum TaxID=586398 RepID=A0AAV2GKW3_9ROSI